MITDYEHFDIEDFASNDSFKNWVLHPSQKSNFFWENYIQNHPHQAHKIELARNLILGIRSAAHQVPSEATVSRLWSTINEHIENEETLESQNFWHHWSLSKIAASVVILLCLGAVFFQYTDKLQHSLRYFASDNPMIEQQNDTQEVLKVRLADGSTVSLDPDSKISYRTHFEEQKREVYLEGEAFFEVTKNPNKPFIVYANDVVTRVLGTSFRIKARDTDQKIVVAVKTGKVSVFKKKDFQENENIVAQNNKGVILKPNQQVVYLKSEEVLSKTLVEKPELLSKKSVISFDFDNTPIAEVFARLEKAYGVSIVYDEELMKNCFLTAPLGNEPLFDKLKVICKTTGATYEVFDGQIVVTSRGCN